MADLDFEGMLGEGVGDGTPPPPLPVGNYRSVLSSREYKTSQAGNKTVHFIVKPVEAQGDVDAAAMEEYGPISEAKLLQVFTFTPKAIWRLDDFLGNVLGIKADSRGEAIEAAIGQEVIVSVTHTPSQDGKGAFANIDSIATA